MPLLALSGRGRDLTRKHVALVLIYLITIGISTAFGVAPVANLFGSLERQMGLITHVSFFICFLGLIVAIGESRARLNIMLWAMALTGLAVATYAFLQFFGRDPFLRPDLYSYQSAAGLVTRVIGTLGHADYLGNFLLYTTPISASLAILASGRLRLLATVAILLSVAAIVFSGTRGAWVGLGAGAIAFALLERAAARNFARGSRRSAYKMERDSFNSRRRLHNRDQHEPGFRKPA